MLPDILVYVPLAPELLDAVGGSNYGDEPYQRELGTWLTYDALPAMARGTKVWLYRNQAGDFVGYGSLGETRWRYPDSASRKITVAIVPAVAIRKEFWGKPDGSAEDRYSSQIMRHLLKEAEAWPGDPPAVGLFVHPDNAAAAKLYQRFGFRLFCHIYVDPETKIVYQSYVRPIVRS